MLTKSHDKDCLLFTVPDFDCGSPAINCVRAADKSAVLPRAAVTTTYQGAAASE